MEGRMDRILSVFGRKISGIFPCALWQDLQNRPPLPTAALVTDIGNDLLYGVTPDRLLEWVERCLDRLADAGAATVVTQLPIDSIERLGEARFRFFRRLLFPRSTAHFGRCAGARARNQRTAHRARRVAKNTGNSSVCVVVRLRSDSFQAARACARVARAARRVARDERAARDRAIVAVDDRLSGDAWRPRNGRCLEFGAAQRNRAVDLATARRFRSIESRSERAKVRFCGAQIDVRKRRSATRGAKNFLRRAKFFAKTCCTISTISYNYQQVTSVFTHFKCSELINEDN